MKTVKQTVKQTNGKVDKHTNKQERIDMKIQTYGAEDVVSRRGGKKTGARYANYANAIGPHLEWLFETIDASTDKMIRVKLADFADACGFKMQKVDKDGKAIKDPSKHNPTSIFWGMKYTLFHAGIVVNSGKVEDNQPVVIMRRKIEGDILPPSLQDKPNGESETDEVDTAGIDTDTVSTEQN